MSVSPSDFPLLDGRYEKRSKPLSMAAYLFEHWSLAANGNGSKNVINLSPVNDPVFEDGGVTLDGSNWLTSSANLNLANGFTASVWVNPTPSNNSCVLSQWLFGLGGFRLGVALFPTPQDIFGLSSYPGSQVVNSFDAGLGYYMLTGVYNAKSNQISLYVNDICRARSVSGDFAASSGAVFQIGTLDGGGEFTYTGFLNNAAIWSRPFTPTQVTALYNGGTPLPFASYASTIA